MMVIRPMMYLALSRSSLIDGRESVGFLVAIKGIGRSTRLCGNK